MNVYVHISETEGTKPLLTMIATSISLATLLAATSAVRDIAGITADVQSLTKYLDEILTNSYRSFIVVYRVTP